MRVRTQTIPSSGTDGSNLEEQDLETETVEPVTIEPALQVELGSVSEKLNTAAKEWSDDLQGLVRTFQGPFMALAEEQQNHIKLIRRERRVTDASAVLREPNGETVDALRAEQQRLLNVGVGSPWDGLMIFVRWVVSNGDCDRSGPVGESLPEQFVVPIGPFTLKASMASLHSSSCYVEVLP